MSFQLQQRTSLEDELIAIARGQLADTVDVLEASRGPALQAAIHESRKRVKKVRAVAAFLEQAGARPPRKDRKRLKKAARALSRVRDSAAIVESFDRVRQHAPNALPEETYDVLRQGLATSQQRLQAAAARKGVTAKAAKRLAKTRKSAKWWVLPPIELSDMVQITTASYRRSREALNRSRATGLPATRHAWRKEVKTLWYHLRLVRPLVTGSARTIADLKRLEGILGEEHDLIVLVATLRGCPDLKSMSAEIGRFEAIATEMREKLKRQAFTLGGRVHARTIEAFTRWLDRATKKTHRPLAAAA